MDRTVAPIRPKENRAVYYHRYPRIHADTSLPLRICASAAIRVYQRYEIATARAMRRSVAGERRRVRAHSHTRRTHQSSARSVRVTFRSRALLRESFSVQNARLVFGIVDCRGTSAPLVVVPRTPRPALRDKRCGTALPFPPLVIVRLCRLVDRTGRPGHNHERGARATPPARDSVFAKQRNQPQT